MVLGRFGWFYVVLDHFSLFLTLLGTLLRSDFSKTGKSDFVKSCNIMFWSQYLPSFLWNGAEYNFDKEISICE